MPQRNHVVRYLADVVRDAQRVPPVGAVEVSVYPPVAGRDFGEEGGVCLWVPGVSKGEGFNEGQRGGQGREQGRGKGVRNAAASEARDGTICRAGGAGWARNRASRVGKRRSRWWWGWGRSRACRARVRGGGGGGALLTMGGV